MSIFSMMSASDAPEATVCSKGIEVHDDEVNRWYLVFGCLLLVGSVFATVEDAAEHFGMKSLYTAAEYRGVTGEVFYGVAFIAELLDEAACTSCRQEFYAVSVEKTEYLVETVFVEY